MERHQPVDPVAAVGHAAFWPVILLVDDLARIFRVSHATARRRLRLGDFGPRVRLGRRWVVLRQALLQHLETSSIPSPRQRPLPGEVAGTATGSPGGCPVAERHPRIHDRRGERPLHLKEFAAHPVRLHTAEGSGA
jgi:hypothetical protein